MQNCPTEYFILIPSIIKIIKLAVANPATSATAEGTFSLARNLKTWLRSTMLPARFRKEQTDKLNLLNVVNEFVSMETRVSLFGRFFDKDF